MAVGTVGGTLRVQLIDSTGSNDPYAPQLGDEFAFLGVMGNLEGDFADLDLPHERILSLSICAKAMPHSTPPAAKASIAQSVAPQPPKCEASQASAIGPAN